MAVVSAGAEVEVEVEVEVVRCVSEEGRRHRHLVADLLELGEREALDVEAVEVLEDVREEADHQRVVLPPPHLRGRRGGARQRGVGRRRRGLGSEREASGARTSSFSIDSSCFSLMCGRMRDER